MRQSAKFTQTPVFPRHARHGHGTQFHGLSMTFSQPLVMKCLSFQYFYNGKGMPLAYGLEKSKVLSNFFCDWLIEDAFTYSQVGQRWIWVLLAATVVIVVTLAVTCTKSSLCLLSLSTVFPLFACVSASVSLPVCVPSPSLSRCPCSLPLPLPCVALCLCVLCPSCCVVSCPCE